MKTTLLAVLPLVALCGCDLPQSTPKASSTRSADADDSKDRQALRDIDAEEDREVKKIDQQIHEIDERAARLVASRQHDDLVQQSEEAIKLLKQKREKIKEDYDRDRKKIWARHPEWKSNAAGQPRR